MPKSRHRRKGRTRPRTHHRPTADVAGSTDRAELLASHLPWIRTMLEADAAEADGDAAEALRLLDDRPGPDGRPFWRPERLRRLRQLVALGDDVPPWAWGRWVVAQAAQSTPGDPQRARDVALETRGGRSTWWGVDPDDALAKLVDHDWVYRQLVVHEHGGLAEFLRSRASTTLLAGAEGVDQWVGVPMGAYLLVGEQPGGILWLDLGSREVVRTLDIGTAAMMAPGEAVIGRLVTPGDVSLFESAPLVVPTSVARRVAERPDSWVAAVSEGCRGPMGEELGLMVARAHHFDLLCDVSARMRRSMIVPEDPGLRPDRLGVGGNGIEYDAALVLAAIGGELDLTGDGGGCDNEACDCDGRPAAPLVAAALLEPGVVEALEPLLREVDVAEVSRLGDVLAGPAKVLCRRLERRLRPAS